MSTLFCFIKEQLNGEDPIILEIDALEVQKTFFTQL